VLLDISDILVHLFLLEIQFNALLVDDLEDLGIRFDGMVEEKFLT
jgi:hypothetical protein